MVVGCSMVRGCYSCSSKRDRLLLERADCSEAETEETKRRFEFEKRKAGALRSKESSTYLLQHFRVKIEDEVPSVGRKMAVHVPMAWTESRGDCILNLENAVLEPRNWNS